MKAEFKTGAAMATLTHAMMVGHCSISLGSPSKCWCVLCILWALCGQVIELEKGVGVFVEEDASFERRTGNQIWRVPIQTQVNLGSQVRLHMSSWAQSPSNPWDHEKMVRKTKVLVVKLGILILNQCQLQHGSCPQGYNFQVLLCPAGTSVQQNSFIFLQVKFLTVMEAPSCNCSHLQLFCGGIEIKQETKGW